MISVYGTTFAHVSEISRGMLVRRLAGFHVVIDIAAIEGEGIPGFLGSHQSCSRRSPGRFTADTTSRCQRLQLSALKS